MAKIYLPPENLSAPEFSKFLKSGCGFNHDGYSEACARHIKDVRAWIKKQNAEPEAGKIISFQVADGYAQYMVMKMKPVTLIHLHHGDGYQFQYAHLLTAKAVREEIRRAEKLEKYFKKGEKVNG